MKRKIFVILPMILVSVCLLFAGCNSTLLPGQRYLTVYSNGMAPSGIYSGDKIIIEEVMISSIDIGDIIAFYDSKIIPPDYNGTKEEAYDFKTGPRNLDSPIILHKVYNIKYDSYGQTWFFTYGTNNLKGEATDDSTIEAVETNYVVEKTIANYVLGKYVGKALS